jgi:hypothetical protein
MDISCQFATSLRSPEHIAAAETLGYRRAWLYDTPAQSPDVWAMLALAAYQTERIGLGPGVLVPTLRHPMVNASGAAMLAALAPGRVAVAFGTGFNGTRALGAPAATWSYLKRYVLTCRTLLRGETVEWDGHPIRMLHPDGHAPGVDQHLLPGLTRPLRRIPCKAMTPACGMASVSSKDRPAGLCRISCVPQLVAFLACAPEVNGQVSGLLGTRKLVTARIRASARFAG